MGRTGQRCMTAIAACLLCNTAAKAQDANPTLVLPDIEVIGVSPVPGTGVNADKVPSNVRSIDGEQIKRSRQQSITQVLDANIGSAAAVDVQNNPYQKDLNYRGFTASPLLGAPQGIAVYQNGIRINEPFGDTVQWDVVPENAIRSVDLVNSNPVFGLNAIGGALAMQLQNGFDYRGAEAAVTGGYFGRYTGTFQAGGGTEEIGGYLAGEWLNDDGWRNVSESRVGRLFADVGFRQEHFAGNVSLTYADTDLTGNGLAPTELLDKNRRALFTTPDITENELFFVSAQGNYDASDTLSIQANTYFRNITRTTLNGDETEVEECEVDAATDALLLADADFLAGVANSGNVVAAGTITDFLCAEESGDDEAEILLDQFGNAIEAFADNLSALNTSTTQTRGYGIGLQATLDDQIANRDNLLVVGGSIDLGITKFHSESALGLLNLDRSVTPHTQTFESTAVWEFSAPGGAVDDSDLERGEVGPVRVRARNDYYGLYVSDTLTVLPNLDVTLAGRLNYAQIDLHDELDSYFPRNSTLDGSHSFSRFNPAAGATYRVPGLGLTAFGGYSEANRAPTPAELTCADPAAPCRLPNAFVADPPLEQVVGRTFEIGLRGDLPSDWLQGITSLKWNVGGFRSEIEDDIIFVSAGPTLGSGFFTNVSETRRQGIEFGLSGLAGKFRWQANYSFIESTFQSTFNVASPNHPQAVAGEIQVRPGDNIPGIPQHNFRFGLDYEVLPGLYVGGNVVATSGVFLRGDEANLLDKTDPYAVLNLRAGYMLNDHLEVFGWIDNVFNTEYETFGVLGETGNEVPIYELPNGITDPRFLSPGQPFGAFVGFRIFLN